jgi:hypothetical protein
MLTLILQFAICPILIIGRVQMLGGILSSL